MYRVIEYFEDLQDDNYGYNPGDAFPRKGLEVSEDRLHELSTDSNKRGKVLIEVVEEEDAEKALQSMTRAELMDVAEFEGVEVKSGMTKAEIIDAIESSREK